MDLKQEQRAGAREGEQAGGGAGGQRTSPTSAVTPARAPAHADQRPNTQDAYFGPVGESTQALSLVDKVALCFAAAMAAILSKNSSGPRVQAPIGGQLGPSAEGQSAAPSLALKHAVNVSRAKRQSGRFSGQVGRSSVPGWRAQSSPGGPSPWPLPGLAEPNCVCCGRRLSCPATGPCTALPACSRRTAWRTAKVPQSFTPQAQRRA